MLLRLSHMVPGKLKQCLSEPLSISARLSAAAVLFCVSSFSIAGDDGQFNSVLSLKQAIAKSLNRHPDLARYAFLAKANEAAITQASALSPVSLNLKVEDALGSGEYSDFSSIKTSIGIGWLLEGDVVNARVNYASAQAKIIAFEQQAKAADVAATTAQIYLRLLVQKQQFKLAKMALEQAKLAFAEVEKRVSAGNANVVDQLRAKANVAQKELTVEDLNHEIEASRAELAAQWQGNDNFTVSGRLHDIPSVEAIDSAYRKLKLHPKFMQLAAEQRISQSAIALAKANETPAWQVNAGVKHDNFTDDVALTAGVSIPFGSENRNQGQIIQLQAKQSAKQAEVDSWQQQMQVKLLLLTHQIKHNRHVIAGLSTDVIPALEQASAAAEQAYQLGRYRYSEWYDVQQALNDAQFELIAAYQNVHQLNIESQRLTATSINL